ncbi:hypothetical protein COCHEDRAFT_1115247, partial [Bipolaris maydis C5]
TSTSEGNGRRGAWSHVMCHPTKIRHPAKLGMAIESRMASHPKHPAKGSRDGIDGIVGLSDK